MHRAIPVPFAPLQALRKKKKSFGLELTLLPLVPRSYLTLFGAASTSIMAQVITDLTDDQIDQLLSAAEASLSDKSSTNATKDKQSLVPVATVPSATQARHGETGKEAVKRPEELTLRVPQLKSKDKKVRCPPIGTISFFIFFS